MTDDEFFIKRPFRAARKRVNIIDATRRFVFRGVPRVRPRGHRERARDKLRRNDGRFVRFRERFEFRGTHTRAGVNVQILVDPSLTNETTPSTASVHRSLYSVPVVTTNRSLLYKLAGRTYFERLRTPMPECRDLIDLNRLADELSPIDNVRSIG